MRKNILTFVLGFSFLFVGVFTVRAETSNSLGKVNNKISKKSVGANLKRLNSLVKKNEAICNQESNHCTEALAILIVAAEAATAACGGADGSNYESSICGFFLTVALEIGDDYVASGCGFSAADSKKNKMWLIGKETIGVG